MGKTIEEKIFCSLMIVGSSMEKMETAMDIQMAADIIMALMVVKDTYIVMASVLQEVLVTVQGTCVSLN